MYFQFEDLRPDAPSFDSVMSRREGFLISVVGHALVVIFFLMVLPRLEFVNEWIERREKEAESRDAQRLEQQRMQQRQAGRFVFVQPLIDTEAPEPPNDGVLSDRDRMAMAPERSPAPTNPLPFARGNSPEFVIRPELAEYASGDGPILDSADGQPDGEIGEEDTALADGEAKETEMATDAETKVRTAEDEGSGQFDLAELGATAAGLPPVASRIPPAESRRPLSGGSLGEAIQNLDRYIDFESFDNPQGGGGQFGPSIQFDSMGVEFGPWIRRFIAQIKRNWLLPYAAMLKGWSGHSVITFNVYKNGSLTDVTVVDPSTTDSFNSSGRNALLASDPTQPLPPEYPADKAFFTVTFYYNERPPMY